MLWKCEAHISVQINRGTAVLNHTTTIPTWQNPFVLGGIDWCGEVSDLALLAEVILTPEARAKLPSKGYLSFLKRSFGSLSIGFADRALWRWPENLQPQHGNSAEQLVSLGCAAKLNKTFL